MHPNSTRFSRCCMEATAGVSTECGCGGGGGSRLLLPNTPARTPPHRSAAQLALAQRSRAHAEAPRAPPPTLTKVLSGALHPPGMQTGRGGSGAPAGTYEESGGADLQGSGPLS